MDSIFSFVNGVFGGETTDSKQEVQYPWNDYAQQAKQMGIHGKIDNYLKKAILEISNYEEFFLIFRKHQESDVEYEFDFENQIELIMALLKEDDKLNTMFAQIVPTRNNEELFWKSYFYRVEQVKSQELMKYSKKEKDLDESHTDILGELDDELDEEIPAIANPSSVAQLDSRLLQQQLAIAMKRIEQLEARVAKLEGEKEGSIHSEEQKEDEQKSIDTLGDELGEEDN